MPSIAPQRPLRYDYNLLPGQGYYKLHTAAKTWDEAREICLTEDSHLLILNTAEEFAAVRTIWDKNPDFTGTDFKNYIHVGLRKAKEGIFVTDKGKKFYVN